jgi:hypothetical protein
MIPLIWLALASPLLADEATVGSVELAPARIVRFATAEEGQSILTADDAFTRSLSRFDLQSRLKTGDEVTLDDWKRAASAEVRDWTMDLKTPVIESLQRLSKRLAAYDLPLPPEILVVRTTGQEEGNAAYTRGTAIVLPDKVLKYAPAQLDKLLAHELFHVMSRHDGAVRQRLYRIIGFEVCEPIELPPSLAPRKITNPDAPLIDCTIELKAADSKVFTGAPVLYANANQYDVTKGGSFFQYLTFRLLVVERKDNRWQPVLLEVGEPVVIDAKKEDAFYEKIGKNTNYIVHPDEILADNFVHLVMENRDLMTPRIVAEMRRALAR